MFWRFYTFKKETCLVLDISADLLKTKVFTNGRETPMHLWVKGNDRQWFIVTIPYT